jgi:hypothetical protein
VYHDVGPSQREQRFDGDEDLGRPYAAELALETNQDMSSLMACSLTVMTILRARGP